MPSNTSVVRIRPHPSKPTQSVGEPTLPGPFVEMFTNGQGLNRVQQHHARAMLGGSHFFENLASLLAGRPFDEVVLHDTLYVRNDDVAEPHVISGISRLGNATSDPAHDDRVDRREGTEKQAGPNGGLVRSHSSLGNNPRDGCPNSTMGHRPSSKFGRLSPCETSMHCARSPRAARIAADSVRQCRDDRDARRWICAVRGRARLCRPGIGSLWDARKKVKNGF